MSARPFWKIAACLALPLVAALARADNLSVDTAVREESRVFFNSVYSFSENTPMEFTGDVANGIPGSTGAAYREAVRVRVNWFRAMAGVPGDIAFSNTYNSKCQQAALMMSANNALTHSPPPTWQHYTAEGAEAAGSSNLYLGAHGPDSITGYIEDPGAENAPLGHRRWILFPNTKTMGTGDVPNQGGKRSANALWVFDPNIHSTRPAVRDEFVAWPPPGYVPYQVVFPRWSFSYPGADFSSATVTLTRNGQPLGKSIEPITGGYGENTISWIPADRDLSTSVLPAPSQDTATTVTVSGVKIGAQTRSFTYTVRVFDPAEPGADTQLANISGPDETTFALPAQYSCASVPRATGYDWEVSTPQPFTGVEGAENDLDHVTADTSGGYDVISSVHAGGAKGFHLANPDFRPQSITLDRVFVPSPSSEIRWQSRLGWASSGQTARVQISVDEGMTWRTIYSQSGTNSAGETAFVSRSKPLADFAGRALRIRFLFDYRSGASAYLSTNNGVGWHLDDIRVTAAEELTTRTALSDNGAATVQITPPGPSTLALRVRPVFFSRFRGEWAPVKRVDATAAPATLTVNISPHDGGTVTGAATGTSAQRVGDTITLTAKPAPGFLFKEWTGAVASTSRSISFLMPDNLLITANFIPDPWPAARGKYTGFIAANPGSASEAGLLVVSLAANGSFSGKIKTGGGTRHFTGRFDPFGNATFGRAHLSKLDLDQIGLPLTLALATDPAASPLTALTATLTGAAAPAGSTTATRSLLTAKNDPQPPLVTTPAEWHGTFTARITATTPAGARGDGCVKMNINPGGKVLLSGRLADGSAFASSARLREDGVFPLYAHLYGGGGALAGEIALEDLPASDASGQLRWFRPVKNSRRFATGWPAGLDCEFRASRFTRPEAGAHLLAALDGTGGTASVTAEFALDSTWPVSVSADGTVTSADATLRGRARRSNGTWKGAFTTPEGTRIRYRGTVLQKEGIFSGWFLTPDGGGRIRLVP